MPKKQKKIKIEDYCDPNDLKIYMAMSAKEKLDYLEEAYTFLWKITPPESKKICEELKKMGW